MSTTAATTAGSLVLIIEPDGDARVRRVPLTDFRVIQALVGGDFEAISGVHNDARWVAHINTDGKRLRLPVNNFATGLARVLGWRFLRGDRLCGVVLFTGRQGAAIADVPPVVIDRAREAGAAIAVPGEAGDE